MADETNVMENLKKEAIRVYDGMTVYYPQFDQTEQLSLMDMAPKFSGCYAVNNSTVAFVDGSEIYVVPYTRRVMSALQKGGFQMRMFYVPFSNWDYPKKEERRWVQLLKAANQEHEMEYAQDCVDYCEKNGIGAIDDEWIAGCFEMPAEGIRVKYHNYEDIYFPIMNSDVFDTTVAERIGRYYMNNGIVLFTYRNGKTYLAKGYGILGELRHAGYKEVGMYVPLSNGEEIVDLKQKIFWRTLIKR